MTSRVKRHLAATAPALSGDGPTSRQAESAVRTLIRWAGDDPERPGLAETPGRVAGAYRDFFAGYRAEGQDELKAVSPATGRTDELIVVRDIRFASHCEHHMVPFLGVAHIAYYPNETIAELPMLARLVDVFARRLQTQERLTAQLADALESALKPKGALVVVEAEHLCMTIRGVRKHGASTVTSRFKGILRVSVTEQARALERIRSRASEPPAGDPP